MINKKPESGRKLSDKLKCCLGPWLINKLEWKIAATPPPQPVILTRVLTLTGDYWL